MMRRFCCFAVLALLAVLVKADEYTPTTMWPYIYEEFTEGTVHHKGGQQVIAHLNIHILEGELHFLKNDEICTVNLSTVDYVELNGDKYVAAGNQIMRVLQENGDGFVLESKLGDFESLFVGSGAYGASANTQSVTNLSSIEIGGKNIVNHSKLLMEKKEDGGRELSYKEKLYIKVGNDYSEALQKEVTDRFFATGIPDDWKPFLKSEKIKWRRSEDLLKVVEFIQRH